MAFEGLSKASPRRDDQKSAQKGKITEADLKEMMREYVKLLGRREF